MTRSPYVPLRLWATTVALADSVARALPFSTSLAPLIRLLGFLLLKVL